MNIEKLIEQFQNKDVSAFEKLFQYYGDSILGVIYNIVRDKELAQDILQDVFIKVWTNSSKYNAKKGRFFTWVMTIARNTSLDKIKSKNYIKDKKNLDVQNFVDIIEADEDFNSKTNAIGLRELVDNLTDNCKKIIEFIYFRGYTQKETSESLEMPLGTVKSRSRLCINELRKLINK